MEKAREDEGSGHRLQVCTQSDNLGAPKYIQARADTRSQ